MQSKGLVTVLAVLLILVSTYQLLFTWKVNQVENKAEAHALSLVPDIKSDEYRNAKNLYLDSLSDEKVFNLGVKKYTYNECKANQLNLGLDLQGGMSVVLQVNLKDFLISLSDNNPDVIFNNALDKAQAEFSKSGGNFVAIFVKYYKELHPSGANARLAPLFNTRDNQKKIDFNFTNEQVIEVINEAAKEAIGNTHHILSTRIDKLGVTSPNIQLDENRGRIIVELAGVDNPIRVRKLLQSTANLEFWLMYRAADAGNFLIQANQIIADELAIEEGLDTNKSLTDTTLVNELEGLLKDSTEKVAVVDNALNDLDSIQSDTPGEADALDEIANDSTLELSDEELKKLYPLTSILQLQIEGNQFIEGPVIGYCQTKDTATVNRYLAIEKVEALFPETMKFRWGYNTVEGAKGNWLQLFAIQTERGEIEPILDGSVVRNAKRDLDQTGKNVVSMNMNSFGSKIWCDVTGDNVDNYIGILVDNGVVSAPVINDKICGGATQISGSFTLEEAEDLANMLNIGKLPARAEIVEEEIVGPTLGKDNIRSGLLSLLFGVMLVMSFMVLYYSGAGIVAVTSLLINILLVIGVLASLGATLTLPGIAGLVLTVGMAVDANVIIFERIREELGRGKPLRQAIYDGYAFSYSTIIDANITTIITAIILASIGQGPVKGFAVVLIIGILSSLFTAVLVARVIIETYLGKKKEKTIGFYTAFSKGKFKNINFDFIGNRKKSYIFSSVLIIAGLISIFTRGFELGVDFKGGREYKVEFVQAVNTSEIKSALDDDAVFNGGTIVKSFGSDNKVKVTTSHMIGVPGAEVDLAVEQKLFNGLRPYLKELADLPDDEAFKTFKETNLLSSTEINPIISKDFKRSSIWATLLSIGGIFLYILIRFSTFKRGGRVKVEFAIGAVACLIHDVIITCGFFSIFNKILPFSMEIDQAFIAAILTVIGYSINDTVVVFDRIREYFAEFPKRTLAVNINNAVNDTLSRTTMTSATTLFTIVVLFFFGGSVLKGFSFALLIGIGIGTYSSIFVATPLMYEISKRIKVKAVESTISQESAKQKRKSKGIKPDSAE